MRTLNLRLAVILLVGGAFISGMVYLLHDFQVKRNAKVFLREADRAESEKHVKDQIKYLGWYVDLAPDNADVDDVLQKLGTLIADSANSGQSPAKAYTVFEQLLRRDATRAEARRKLVDVAMSMGRYPDAKAHLRYLLHDPDEDDPKSLPGDTAENAPLWELLGRCQWVMGEDKRACISFEKAIKLAPDQLESYADLASVLRNRLDNAKEADQWMQKLVKSNPKSTKAYILFGVYLMKTGANEKALQYAEQALKMEPNNREGLYVAAQCAMAMKRNDEARKYAARGIKLYPENAIMYVTMAEIELRSGNRDKALATLHEGLEATKHHLQIVWHLANLYMDGRKLTEAQALIQELHAGKFSPVFLSYLDGRMEFCQGHWLTAKNALEKIRPALSDFPAQQKMADFCIGVCYGKMENYDQQLLAFRRAVAIDPNFVPAHAGIAEVLLAAGQTSGAIEEYWQVVKSDRASAESWTNLASMLVLKNSHMDPADRDWDEVESALDTAVKLQPNLAQVAILRAEVMIAKNHPDVAERLLEDLRDKNPDRPEFWTVLVSLAERRTEWDKAERLLNDADKKFGDNVALRLARAQYLVRRYGNDAAQRLRALAEKTDKFSKTDVIQLNRGLVIPSLQANDDAQARRLCEIVSKAEPDDVHNHFLRFELALRAQDSTNLEAILNDIEKNTGRNYMWSYGQAVRLSLEAKGHDEKSMKALAEAQKYLAQARETRPTWSRLPLLAAGIYDQQGKFDQALENYQQAIKWGERNPEAVRRAVQLLYMRGKFTEAQRMLRQLDERHMPLTQELQQMDIEVALRQEDYAHAKELALKSTVIDPKNWQQQLWLGQVLGILGRRAKAENRAAEAKTTLADAEKAFRRAIELKPDIPETWISLVQFLVGIDEADKAKAVVAQAGEKLPAKAAPAALAQCYEALRDIEHAQEKYQQALAGDPSDPEILRRVADFYLRTSRLLAAEPLLQKLVDGKDKYPIDHVVWARRQLALSVAARGGYQNLQAARKLIEANLALGDPSVQDLRARATFQAVDADPAQRRDAIHTMEYLISLEEMTSPEDRYTLAKLYLNQGEWPKARTILRSLAARGADPRHTATYIGALLQHNELSEAEAWLGGLEKMMPDQFVSVNFRADIAVRRGQPDEALDVMQKFAEKPGAPPAEHLERLRLAGGGLEQLAAHLGDTRQKATSVRFLQKAEMAYRNYAEQGAAQQMFLAGFLARHGKTQEALAIVSDRWADSNPAAIAQALSVIGSGKSSPSQIQQAEGIFKDALKKFDRATPLLLGIAVLCANSDRDDEAEIYYREVIAKDPNNAEALNNLAGLLSHQPNRLEEAMQLVNRAIDVAGPMSAILDTRAVIFLVGKKPDRAMPDITTALADNLTPIHLFHQAWAYYQLGRRGEATDILAQAEKAGLTASSLDSHERPIYSAMRDDLR